MNTNAHAKTVRALLRDPLVGLVAALAYTVVYEWVFWVLLTVSIVARWDEHQLLGEILGIATIAIAFMRMGAMLERFGTIGVMRDWRAARKRR